MRAKKGAKKRLPAKFIATERFLVSSGEVIVGDPHGGEADRRVALDNVHSGTWVAILSSHRAPGRFPYSTYLLCGHADEYMTGQPDGNKMISASLASGLCGVVDAEYADKPGAIQVIDHGHEVKDLNPLVYGVLAPAAPRLQCTPVFVYRTPEDRIVGIYLSFLVCESILPEHIEFDARTIGGVSRKKD